MLKKLILFVVAWAAGPLAAYAVMPYDAVARLSPPDVTWGGSCVLIRVGDDKGLIVTNAHVASGRDDWVAHWPAGSRKAKVVKYLPDSDLCFLVVNDPPVQPVRLGIRDSHVVFTGYPHYEREHLHWQYGNVVKDDLMHTQWRNMPVPGMSGGGVFDRKDGDLCGLVKADKNGHGWGVSDVTLILMAADYEKPETWIPNGKECVADKREWSLAKPVKVVITKEVSDEDPPTWEGYDDERTDEESED